MRVRPRLFAALPSDALHRYRVRVLDTTGETTITLYDSGGHVAPGAAVYGGGVSFGERRWRVQLQPRDSGYDASLLWLMGANGTVPSLLLALLLWSAELGNASFREIVCSNLSSSLVAVSLKIQPKYYHRQPRQK